MNREHTTSILAKMLAIGLTLFKAQLVYRFDVIMNIAGVIDKLLFAWVLWGVVYQDRDTVAGFTYAAMLQYYIVSAFFAALDESRDIAFELQARIQGGTFSRFMVLPIHPSLYFMASQYGAVSYYAIFCAISTVVAGTLFLPSGWTIPGAGESILALVMLPVGLTFMVLFHFMLGILAMKLQDVGMHIWGNIIDFLKGTMIPLALLPQGVQRVLSLFPFQYAAYTPTMLLTGQASVKDGLTGLLILAIWTALAAIFSRVLYDKLRLQHEGVGI